MSPSIKAIESIQVITNYDTEGPQNHQDGDSERALNGKRRSSMRNSANEQVTSMGGSIPGNCSLGLGCFSWTDWTASNLMVVLGLTILILSCQVASASPTPQDYGISSSADQRGFMLGKRMKHPSTVAADRVISLPDQLNNLDEIIANADLDLEGAEAMELMADLARADQVDRMKKKIQKLIRQKQQVAREARQEYLQLVDDLRYQRNEYEQGRLRPRSKRSSTSKDSNPPRQWALDNVLGNEVLPIQDRFVPLKSDSRHGHVPPFLSANDQPLPIFAC